MQVQRGWFNWVESRQHQNYNWVQGDRCISLYSVVLRQQDLPLIIIAHFLFRKLIFSVGQFYCFNIIWCHLSCTSRERSDMWHRSCKRLKPRQWQLEAQGHLWVFPITFNSMRAEPSGRRQKRLYTERHPHAPPNNANHSWKTKWEHSSSASCSLTQGFPYTNICFEGIVLLPETGFWPKKKKTISTSGPNITLLNSYLKSS